jgi:hypothetical protein
VRLFVNPLIATGGDAATVAASREKHRALLATLYSTPSYWPSLEVHGWRAVGERLNGLVRANRWGELADLISDEMLEALMVAAPYPELAVALRERWGGLADAYVLALPPADGDDAALARVVRDLRGD